MPLLLGLIVGILFNLPDFLGRPSGVLESLSPLLFGFLAAEVVGFFPLLFLAGFTTRRCKTRIALFRRGLAVTLPFSVLLSTAGCFMAGIRIS